MGDPCLRKDRSPLIHLRRAVPATATAACALLLSGCVVIQNVSEQQVDGIGPVRVNMTLCSSGDDAACVEQGHPTGGNDGNGGPDTGANPTQLLVGFRIPDAYAAPSAPTSADHPEVTFTSSPSYAAGLKAQSPSGPGQQWVGFISSTTAMGNGSKAPGTVDAMTVTAGFAVPPGTPPLQLPARRRSPPRRNGPHASPSTATRPRHPVAAWGPSPRSSASTRRRPRSRARARSRRTGRSWCAGWR